MINEIIDGVIKRLDETFGDKFPYMREISEQGISGASFYVKALKPSRKQLINTRGEERYPLDIHFFNYVDTKTAYDVADRLRESLESIVVSGDVVHGTDIEFEIQDEVLHFFVIYTVVTRSEQESCPTIDCADINITT